MIENTKKQRVHIVLQEKGGIGKSFIANMLLQYFNSKGLKIQGIDTDPSNSTLSSYKSLNVKKIDIMEGKRVDIKRFDVLMKMIYESDSDFIVDIGSSNFITFYEYVTEQGIFRLIQDMGAEIFLHIVVVGGEAKEETLLSFKKIVENDDVTPKSVVIWENNHFGKIHESQSIVDSPVIQKLSKKIFGGIILEQSNNDLLGNDLQLMQKKHYTFEEVKKSNLFSFMEKIRINKYMAELWQKFDMIFIDGER